MGLTYHFTGNETSNASLAGGYRKYYKSVSYALQGEAQHDLL